MKELSRLAKEKGIPSKTEFVLIKKSIVAIRTRVKKYKALVALK